jgi:RNA polymerase sigma-70 factor (ECF subfamily)
MDGPETRPSRRPADLTPSLLARLRSGDSTAGRLLEESYRRPLLRFCRNQLGRPVDAEEAVQETFCRVLQAKDVPDSFRAWLYRVARNVCLDLLRQRVRHRDQQAPPLGSHLPAALTGNLSRLVRQELDARLAHLVAALPQEQREVLYLRYAEELSRPEIAYVLDIPEATVKSRLFQAVRKLREHTSLLDRS